MGVFQKIAQLLKANINDLIEKAADPEKMLNQLIEDMEDQLQKARVEVANALADEKLLEKKVEENKKLADEWQKKAEFAVAKGEDELAVEALKRKREYERLAQEYQKQYEAQHEAVEKLKSGLRMLEDKIEEAKRRRDLLIARSKRADAQMTITQTMSKLTDTSAFESFERYAQKIEQKEARAQAQEELLSASKTLEDRFKELENSDSDILDELQKLKEKMGK
ncbi:PspA/IM30 family protein [Caldicellulosiruptor morganii]|uniref:PspA/IM30 family protein n=1 Tax=Caldicellulosiruptor morganii TaxID=1387555 RepID=A0ABY7BM57_9FIRM|nr:PspA/IM30 family protein [Caldicellulosiruptor morganii]WAM33933.1 PspA/IM30 family protein [Caldicellulosiruptor morganii]